MASLLFNAPLYTINDKKTPSKTTEKKRKSKKSKNKGKKSKKGGASNAGIDVIKALNNDDLENCPCGSLTDNNIIIDNNMFDDEYMEGGREGETGLEDPLKTMLRYIYYVAVNDLGLGLKYVMVRTLLAKLAEGTFSKLGMDPNKLGSDAKNTLMAIFQFLDAFKIARFDAMKSGKKTVIPSNKIPSNVKDTAIAIVQKNADELKKASESKNSAPTRKNMNKSKNSKKSKKSKTKKTKKTKKSKL